MNILIVSNNEHNTFKIICDGVLNMPDTVTWKILANREFHQNLISLFGKDRFIDIPIRKLKEHVQEENKPFDFLAQLSERYIIIPSDFQSLKFLTQNKKSFPGHVVCPLMDLSLLLFLDDKHNMMKVAEACGVRSPKEYKAGELAQLPASQRLVIKPALGDGSKGVFMSKNKQHAIAYYERLSHKHKASHVIQEYVDGEDFYYYGICHQGKVLVSSVIKPGLSKHLGTYFMEHPAIEDHARKIVEHYQYSGPISIDFRIEKNSNEVYLIEINPRNGNNCYLFNIVHTNWLMELAKVSENPGSYSHTHKIVASRWTCYWKLPMMFFFYKLKLYKFSAKAG